MALFTESQANACTITQVKRMVSGSDCSWGLGAKDANGTHYNWLDNTLASDASKNDIKAAVKAKLLELDKKDAIIPVITTLLNESDDKGIGETIG